MNYKNIISMFYQQATNSPVNYYYYKSTFTEQEIKNILFKLQSINYESAKVASGEPTPEMRVSNIKWIPKTEEWGWLYQKLMEVALEANQKLWNFDILNVEEIQYTEYNESNNGHYNWHQDLGDGLFSHRKISISVQLSDPSQYNGGDLQFWLGGESNIVSVEKSLGEATIFPSYLMHRVTKVYWGTRKSLVMWIGGSHFR
jgi:PKHD-type hydroxylase